ncbi:polysaccharide biosynthesis tyrosine autokinase [Sphingomonas sp. LY29]|uniref:GumC family protein n=1 Tax=Sphingomonas sp. LY29 TaxID=3095341 RepID=UPI002D778117|nr:polysaccharide biosynthesis tyrosine autokinase [Sphingomonas sp. LY29]WRP26247.1 polysaccharide biosynthesis tyrosine autokinase [Sphingomonas sp. LY29]
MNNNIAVSDDNTWVVDRYSPDQRPQAPQKEQGMLPGLDFAALFRIVSHWRWLILGAIALGILAAIVVTMLTKPMYRSFVTLEVSPPTVEIMDERRRESATAQTNWGVIATQVGLLSSRAIAERTAQDLNLANNEDFVGTGGTAESRLEIATSRVAGGLDVKAPKEGQLIEYSYEAETPQLAASIANGVADSFINSTLQRRYDASAYARTFLERQIVKVRSDLERSERQLVAYAQAQGIINIGSGENGQPNGDVGSLQGESLVALNQALSAAVARRVAAEGAYRQSMTVGPTTEDNSGTQALRQSRAALEAEYQDKRTLMKPDHPEMLSLRSRIDELNRQISRETSQVASGRSNSLLSEYRGAQAAENALQGRVNALKGSVLNLRGRSIQYNILQREVDTNRSLYDALLQRFKEVGVAGGIGSAPVSIVDKAEVPGGPFRPNLFFNLLLGSLFGLVLGMLTAIALEFLYDTIKTREDVRSKLGLACLGAIPKTTGKDSFVDELKDPKSIVSEAYSSVVASLRFSTEGGLPKTLVVTSTRPSEGKSSSSLALSQNFARRGARVLLMDSDLRKPAFKAASDKYGLTRLLTDEGEDLRKHVLPTQFENLWLMPSGPIPPNPADLLSTGRFQQILAEASGHFDIIVIDAPPVMGLADSLMLASFANAVMFVVESGKTRTKAALEALGMLRGTGAQIVGATLTKAAEDMGGYGYKAYGYGAIDKKRTEILMIPHEGDA